MFVFTSIFAILLYLFGACIDVFSNVMIKYVNINNLLSTGEIIVIKSLLSVLLLLPFNVKYIAEKQTRSKIVKNILLLLALGIASVISQFTWVNAIKMIPINNAWLMVMIFSTLLGAFGGKIFFKEQISNHIKFAFVINLCAILLVNRFSVNKIEWNVGYLLLIADVFAYVSLMLLTRKLQDLPAGLLVFIRFLVVVPMSLIAIHYIPQPTYKALVFMLIIVLCCLCGRVCITRTYKHLEVSTIQPLRYFNIVFAIIFSFFVLGEKPTLYQIVGGIVIIISGVIVGLEKRK